MTNDEKALLKSLVKEGYSAETIACYVNCSMATIKKYIRIFRKKDKQDD